MKRLFKLFTTCILAALLITGTTFTAFADDSTTDMDAMMQEYAASLISQITAESDDAALDQAAEYYAANGFPGVAEGFTDWKSLYATVGAMVSVEETNITYGEDGSAAIVSNVKFENANVVATIVISADGYVTELSFEKEEAKAASDLGEKLKDASVNLVVGMGTVFAVLIFLCGVIYLFRFISKAEKAIADKKAAKNAKPAAAEAAPTVTEVTPAPASDDELQAVIAAAIAAYESENGSGITKQPSLTNGINIKTYRRN